MGLIGLIGPIEPSAWSYRSYKSNKSHSFTLLFIRPAYAHARRTQQAGAEPVARLKLFDHPVVFVFRYRDYFHRFVNFGVEFFSRGGYRAQAQVLHLGFEHIGRGAHAVQQRDEVGILIVTLFGGRDRALEIVQSVEQPGHDVAARGLQFLVESPLQAGALLVGLGLKPRLRVAEAIREIAHLTLSLDAFLFGLFQSGSKLFDFGRGFDLLGRQVFLEVLLALDGLPIGHDPALIIHYKFRRYQFRFGSLICGSFRGLSPAFMRLGRAVTFLLITLIGIHNTT